ncbi:hypothetical protein C0992_003265, partial [Termitomyces sp. T32_za158]
MKPSPPRQKPRENPNPIEEREDADSLHTADGGDAEIISQMQREMTQKAEVIDIDDSDDSDNDLDGDIS